MQPFDVTVELDGVAIGSAPGEFKAAPGLHKLRLSREDFQDWVKTVNIYNGQSLRVALNMSEAGYERWKDTFDFLVSLESSRKLTDAEVKRLEGVAQMLRNSHFNVDHAENLIITDQNITGPGASAPVYAAPAPVYAAPAPVYAAPAPGYYAPPASAPSSAPAQAPAPAPVQGKNNKLPTLFNGGNK